MRAEINKKGQLSIICEEYDLCERCKNATKCPLIQAISQEIVILHYSDIAIGECGLYQKGK
jgi:hypothetical protein